MSQDKNNKKSRRDRLRQLVNGMQLHMQNVTALTIAGVVYKTPDLIAGIQSDIAASDESEAMHGAWLGQVTQEKASHEQVDPAGARHRAVRSLDPRERAERTGHPGRLRHEPPQEAPGLGGKEERRREQAQGDARSAAHHGARPEERHPRRAGAERGARAAAGAAGGGSRRDEHDVGARRRCREAVA